ncbi:hypothetical protein ACFS5N_03995 [Mucilaginibacter ximonensis]|uniref:Lipoprotein n=1 Tax=Mucilaginibacter ximonensis TaxID=538021 RepID=A0ABW5Y8C6_9SPHI
MKNQKLLLVIAVLLAVTLFACKKSGVTSAFDKSYDAWLSYKKKVNNNYAYIAVEDGDNSHAETKITVTNGEITARDYAFYDSVYKPDSNVTRQVLTEQWHESADNYTLSTHADGAQLFTLDDIYYRAQNIWLKADQSKNKITFETNNNGIISAAGYTPNSCKSGDCFIGAKIKSIMP